MKNSKLIKTILVFILYLFYTQIVSSILNIFNINNEVITMFIADLLFIIGIVFAYKDNIKKDFIKFNKENKPLKIIKKILFWVFMIFVINIIGGIITELIIPSLSLDDNTESLKGLFNMSFLYTMFKTLIFASVAEELVFKESVREVVSNDILFVIVSTFMYVSMNLVYADLTFKYILADAISYALFAIVTSIMYIKNKSNICLVMLVKFCYNLIPFTLLLLGLGA